MKELYHHGIIGMKWGVRRYQNEDGTLTELGKKHYGYGDIEVRRTKITGNYGKKYDGYSINRAGNKNVQVEYFKDSFERMEREAEEAITNYIAENANVTVSEAIKAINDSDEAKQIVNQAIDSYMHITLDEALKKAEEIEQKESESKAKANTKASGEKKYTQKQAIDKIYSELEKKYKNFDSLSVDKQDELFFKYAKSSGLDKYL